MPHEWVLNNHDQSWPCEIVLPVVTTFVKILV
jgi:hypothetical protein